MNLHPKVGEARERRQQLGLLPLKLPLAAVHRLDEQLPTHRPGAHVHRLLQRRPPRGRPSVQRKVVLVLQHSTQRASAPTSHRHVQRAVTARVQTPERAAFVRAVDPVLPIRRPRVVKRVAKRVHVAVVRRGVDRVRRRRRIGTKRPAPIVVGPRTARGPVPGTAAG